MGEEYQNAGLMQQSQFVHLLSSLAAEHDRVVHTLQKNNDDLRHQIQKLTEASGMAESVTEEQEGTTAGSASTYSKVRFAPSCKEVQKDPTSVAIVETVKTTNSKATSPKKMLTRSKSLKSKSLKTMISSVDSSAIITEHHVTEHNDHDFHFVVQGNWKDQVVHILLSPAWELATAGLIVLNTFVMALELQINGSKIGYHGGYKLSNTPPGDVPQEFFVVFERTFTILFALELVISIAFLGKRFLKASNIPDVIVVLVGIADWAMSGDWVVNPMIIRLVRLCRLSKGLRIIRSATMLESLRMLLKCGAASYVTLFWSLCVLLVIQCIAGMIISQLVRGYIEVPSSDPDVKKIQQMVFNYYGTFTRSMLTMFEVTLANWSPPCRVLVDHVSEWYSTLFIVYRCLVGFAALSVINAVFIQKTMSVVQQDKEVMIMMKQKSQAASTNKLRELFHHLDTSNDGRISWEEMQGVLDSKLLQAWMSALEISSDDLEGLFEMLDDGDGHIALDEFTRGAERIKGPAKAFDMMRMFKSIQRLQRQMEFLIKSSPLSCNCRNLQVLETACPQPLCELDTAQSKKEDTSIAVGDEEVTTKACQEQRSQESDLKQQVLNANDFADVFEETHRISDARLEDITEDGLSKRDLKQDDGLKILRTDKVGTYIV